MNFCFLNPWFSKNYNSWDDYVVLENLQGDHFEEFIMVFDILGWSFSPPLPLLSKTSHYKPHGIKECPNQLCRNVGPSWLFFLGSHIWPLNFYQPNSFFFSITLYWSFYVLQYFDDVLFFFFHFATFCQSAFFQHTLVSFLFSFFFIIFLSFFCSHFLCYLFFCVHVLIVLFIWFFISNLAFFQFVRRCRSWLPNFILIFLTIMCVFFHFILSIVLSLFFTCNVV
jgi:hypothetical protein